jgi:hypothetical protein
MSAHLSRLRLFQRHLRSLVWVWVWVWDQWLSGLGLNFLLASVSFTLSLSLSLDSFCRPTTCKSSSPAGLFPLVYAYVVDCVPASPYAYSSSTHRFPDDRTPIKATHFSATSAELGLGLGLGLGLDSLSHFSSHTLPFFPQLCVSCSCTSRGSRGRAKNAAGGLQPASRPQGH